MPQVTDTWVIDLKLNDASFNSSFAKIKNSINNLNVSGGGGGGGGNASRGLNNLSTTFARLTRSAGSFSNIFKGGLNLSKFMRLGQAAFTAASAIGRLAVGFANLAAKGGPVGIVIGSVVAVLGTLAAMGFIAKPLFASFGMKMVEFSQPFLEAASNIQQLEWGLKSLGLTTQQVQKTFELGKLPGLTREQAAQSVEGLVAGGFGFDQAAAMTESFARIGMPSEKLRRFQIASQQMMAKGKITAEEVSGQMAEAIGGRFPILLAKAFGTTDISSIIASGMSPQQFLAGLATAAAQMPAMTGSIASGMENLQDTIEKLKASVGAGMAKFILPFFEKLGAAIDKLVASGALERIGESLAQWTLTFDIEGTIQQLMIFGTFAAGLVTKLGDFITMMQNIGDVITPIILVFDMFFRVMSFGLVNLADAILMFIPIVGPILFLLKQVVDLGMRGVENTRKQKAKELEAEKPTTTDALKKLRDAGVSGTMPVAPVAKKDESKNNEQLDTLQNANEIQQRQLDQLKSINKNTNPDLQAMILGGGNIGRQGVSQADISAYKKTQNRGRGGNFSPQVITLFDQLMSQIAKEISGNTITTASPRFNF